MSIPVGEGGIVVGAARSVHAEAIDIARDFLDALDRRDLAAATALLAPQFSMRVTGGHRFAALADFAAYAASRYASFRKSGRQFDACDAALGVVVYAHGSMSGEWREGGSFQDVRWVDRFVIQGARITELQTLSEIGEFRPR
jgi:ketosteroid isomerase-like protein